MILVIWRGLHIFNLKSTNLISIRNFFMHIELDLVVNAIEYIIKDCVESELKDYEIFILILTRSNFSAKS